MPYVYVRKVGPGQKYLAAFQVEYVGYDRKKKRPITRQKYLGMVNTAGVTRAELEKLLAEKQQLERRLREVTKSVNTYFLMSRVRKTRTKNGERPLKEAG